MQVNSEMKKDEMKLPQYLPELKDLNDISIKETKTPSPQNVIMDLNSEFRRCKVTPDEEIVIRNKSGKDTEIFYDKHQTHECSLVQIESPEYIGSHSNSINVAAAITRTPILAKIHSSSVENIDYMKSSPGTNFVSELSEYIELEQGQYGILAGIMDRQWNNVVMKTDDD